MQFNAHCLIVCNVHSKCPVCMGVLCWHKHRTFYQQVNTDCVIWLEIHIRLTQRSNTMQRNNRPVLLFYFTSDASNLWEDWTIGKIYSQYIWRNIRWNKWNFQAISLCVLVYKYKRYLLVRISCSTGFDRSEEKRREEKRRKKIG